MEKKKKEDKKPVIDFDNIDITTATDDDIIRSGLKKNTNADYICYAIMGVIFIMIFIPPALWIFNPKPITQEEREIVYTELTCRRSISRDGYELYTSIISHYRETSILDSEITHSYLKISQQADDNYVFAEINELNSLNFKEIKTKKEENKYIYNIDFKSNYDTLTHNEILKDFAYIPNAETQYLTNLGYYCFSETKQQKEIVYVDTGEQVKE